MGVAAGAAQTSRASNVLHYAYLSTLSQVSLSYFYVM